MKNGVVVIGAGGHAKVCVESLFAAGENVAYCVGEPDGPAECGGVPVMYGDEHIQELWDEGYRSAFIAVGSNSLRESLAQRVLNQGFRLVNAISPAATVSPSAKVGVGVAIMAGAIVNAEAIISDLAIVNTGATIDHDCRIGRAVHIAPQCALAGCVKVGEASFLGIGCKVVPEVSIGENVVVGAGSVVISDLPPMVTAVGVPARILNQKTINQGQG